jgi:hypothetical protein
MVHRVVVDDREIVDYACTRPLRPCVMQVPESREEIAFSVLDVLRGCVQTCKADIQLLYEIFRIRPITTRKLQSPFK